MLCISLVDNHLVVRNCCVAWDDSKHLIVDSQREDITAIDYFMNHRGMKERLARDAAYVRVTCINKGFDDVLLIASW